MPRPLYKPGEKTARERLADAFWECLEETPLEKITVADIVKHAGVNRNTFYYHFADINDLAAQALKETALKPGTIRAMLAQLMSGRNLSPSEAVPDLEERTNRICLLAGKHGTAELRAQLRSEMLAVWEQVLEVDFASCDLEGRLALEFALGGFMALIAYRADSGNSFGLDTVFEYGINLDAFRLLRHIPEVRDKLPL